MAAIGMQKVTGWSFDEALARIPELLKAEGFGVLTEIDVKGTLKQKLGVDFRRYRILGACNPSLAHQALSAVTEIGALLPCNVVVYERDDGKAMVVAVDPMQTIAAAEPKLSPIAQEVRGRLARVLERIG
ncbi:DUF302 domain-containing protein [Anaeromyxobacter oryzae]|uniref:DUF302 domain-containing protein n=1 Tax=Anaeromyxobacter oryzae TaxID=2918170 RepID=A0ABM7WX86_9BACT|nr:DUF302 domain-containing protein [Anaeromyxobacter oryzae]BDG04092.1 hypothetical protein AMOR_30880 [Anaeromyxobacter oryzae]